MVKSSIGGNIWNEDRTDHRPVKAYEANLFPWTSNLPLHTVIAAVDKAYSKLHRIPTHSRPADFLTSPSVLELPTSLNSDGLAGAVRGAGLKHFLFELFNKLYWNVVNGDVD